jgi:hypothetical protein
VNIKHFVIVIDESKVSTEDKRNKQRYLENKKHANEQVAWDEGNYPALHPPWEDTLASSLGRQVADMQCIRKDVDSAIAQKAKYKSIGCS